MMSKSTNINYRVLRDCFTGLYMANNGYDKNRAEKSLGNEDSDLVAFGVPFLANPDLVYRFQNGLALNDIDFDTFYGGAEQGYIDYPYYDNIIAESA